MFLSRYVIKEVETTATSLNIPFSVLFGNPIDNLTQYAINMNAACVVTDFSPLRENMRWVMGVRERLEAAQVPFVQVINSVSSMYMYI